jgi:transposase
MSYRQGEGRNQATLFAVTLDDLVEPDAAVRVVDAWVASLDLRNAGFRNSTTAATGRPPYHPGDLLKLYLYGYMNGVRSSRKLERECHRNTELMWMLGRLAPDHKTIAEFRRRETDAIVASAAAFVKFAQSHRLISGDTVAIDGSKIRAVASNKAALDKRSLLARDQAIEQEISKYLKRLDDEDASEPHGEPSSSAIQKSLRSLRKAKATIAKQLETLQKADVEAMITTEPEARRMQSLRFAPGYNLQSAVDAKSHLIVHHDVSNSGNDFHQLKPMSQAVASVLGRTNFEVLVDKGYAYGEQIAALEAAGIEVVVPRTNLANSSGDGSLYEASRFKYDPKSDTYRCPANQVLKKITHDSVSKKVVYGTEGRTCTNCEKKGRCTTSDRRRIHRSHFEQSIENAARRLEARPDSMRRRAQTVEHPFGTIKHQILGNARLLMRGLGGARAELSLSVLAYNVKRVISLMGSPALLRTAEA